MLDFMRSTGSKIMGVMRLGTIVGVMMAVLAVGCRSSSEKATGAAVGSAAPQALACSQVAEHLTALVIADTDKPGFQLFGPEIGPVILRVVTARCDQDHWNEAAKNCYFTAKTTNDMSPCEGKLTGEQLAKMQADMEASSRKTQPADAAPSSPGSGSADDKKRLSLLGQWRTADTKASVEFFGDGSFSFPGVADSGTYTWTDENTVQLDFTANGETKFLVWSVEFDGDVLQSVIVATGYRTKWLRASDQSEAAKAAKRRDQAKAEREAALKREAPSLVSVSATGCRCAAGTSIVVSCRIQNGAQVPVLVSLSAYSQTGTMGQDARGNTTSSLRLDPGKDLIQEVTTYFSSGSDCLSCRNSACRVGVTAL